MNIFFSSILLLTLLGSLAGWILVYISQKFSPNVDPLIEKVRKVLPGINCGACGISNCDAFAKAVVQGKAKTNSCVVGREKVAKAIEKIIGR